MNDTITREVVELEEWFAQEIPCGGNNFPEPRKCPASAPATLISVHRCTDHPYYMKCDDCYRIWLDANLKLNRPITCFACGCKYDARQAYRPL